ncbi:MAG TPA: helicase-related protein [Pyrinomonadaceae bacterium]|nr:helicase-related protein [Pyrinomonadaceae bacterium]
MRFKLPEIPPPKLITALRNYNLLPAIVFMPTRRKCDEAATEVAADKSQKMDIDKQEERQAIYEEFLAEFPEIKTHKHRRILIRAGIAAHHAGHIPAWKLLVEKMMQRGLLNAIFATSTVAAGVDFPARTVVISNADTRGNDGWRALQASELQQMTGRAGRRGKDNVGFVILAPAQFQNPPKIAQLLKSPPDALNSQFRATYTSLLNLLDAFGNFAQVREITEKSFAFRETARQIAQLEKHREKRRKTIEKKFENNDFGLTIDAARGFERLVNSRSRLQEKSPNTRAEVRVNWLRENVQIGRIVTKSRNSKRFFLVLNVFGEKVMAMREDGQGATLSLPHIGRVFEKEYRLEERSLDLAFDEIHEGKNPALDEPKLSLQTNETDEAAEILTATIEKLLPANLSEAAKRQAHQILWETVSDVEFLEKIDRDIEILRGEIWLPFENRARVLNHFGYLDFAVQKVTEKGKWLADVRVDRPVLVGEALRHGLFENLEIKHIAALMASLAADSDRNYGELHLSDEILEILTTFEDIIYEVSGVEFKCGVAPADEINLSAAAAAEHWADGADWQDLVYRTKAEEGDLVRLLSRTGEALKQISQLKESHPKAAQMARTTAEILLREPIR